MIISKWNSSICLVFQENILAPNLYCILYTHSYHTMRKNITKFSNLFVIFKRKLNNHLEKIEKWIPLYLFSHGERYLSFWGKCLIIVSLLIMVVRGKRFCVPNKLCKIIYSWLQFYYPTNINYIHGIDFTSVKLHSRSYKWILAK